MPPVPDIQTLADGIIHGERASLSQGITLVESTQTAHLEAANALLHTLLPQSETALRVAITGAPGVGKSTLIETLGLHLIASHHRIAVLSIDPSSPQTGGSILGDKTRMPHLAKHPDAFIRPSPSGNTSGGITHTTRAAASLCAAAGYNPILIETVGTGQSEYAVRQMVDVMILLVLAHAGDELQGIKRGILETTDLIAVTKADGLLKETASLTAKAYRRSVSLYFYSFQTPKVLVTSALDNSGVTGLWEAVKEFECIAREHGHFQKQRQDQVHSAVLDTAKSLLVHHFGQTESVQIALQKITQQVLEGKYTIPHAAQRLLDEYKKA